jgi:hypothetical protein
MKVTINLQTPCGGKPSYALREDLIAAGLDADYGHFFSEPQFSSASITFDTDAPDRIKASELALAELREKWPSGLTAPVKMEVSA